MKYFAFVLALLQLIQAPWAWAVLPPEEHKKMQERYIKSVNFIAEIAFKQAGPKAGDPTVCRAVYEIKKIKYPPPFIEIAAGERIALDYPCAGWLGSFYPWANRREDGVIEMVMNGSYLDQKGGFWVIENEKNTFSPVLPPEEKTSEVPGAAVPGT